MLLHFGNWISVRDHSRSDRPTDRTSVDLQRKERSHKMLLTSYKNWRRQHPLQGMHCHDVWHHHIRKTPFLSVHSKRMSRPWSRLFQKTTLWGPFSITSVCRVQKRLGGRKAKTEEKISVFKNIQINMDGTQDVYVNKSASSSLAFNLSFTILTIFSLIHSKSRCDQKEKKTPTKHLTVYGTILQ